MLRTSIAVCLMAVGFCGGETRPDDEGPKEIWIDLSTDEQIGGVHHGLWVEFPSKGGTLEAKVRHAYGRSAFDLVLTGAAPIEAPAEREAGGVLMYSFVNRNAQGIELASVMFLYAPRDGSATGFLRLANGVRATVRGRSR